MTDKLAWLQRRINQKLFMVLKKETSIQNLDEVKTRGNGFNEE